MKKKFLFTILPLIACLAACGQINADVTSSVSTSGVDNATLCEQAIDSLPLLLNGVTGKEMNIIKGTKTSEDYTSYLALNTLTWKNKEFNLDWVCAPTEKWTVSTYSEDASRTKLMPKYGEEAYECSITLNLSVKDDAASTKSVSWKFMTEVHTKPVLDDFTYYSLETLSTEYADDNSKHSGEKIYTFGYITATMEPNSTHLYSGVFIQDGNYGLQLYAGKLWNIWSAVGFNVGDLVMVAGTTSPYNGLMEVKPTYLEFASSYEQSENVAEPVVNNLDDETWGLETIGQYQNTIVTISGLTYKSVGTMPSPGVHGEVFFDKDGTEIGMYINYHIGTDAMNALKTLIGGWTADVTTIDFYGVLSICGDLEIFPVFGTKSITVK